MAKNLKEHLIENHTGAARHATEVAKCHQSMATCHKDFAGACEPDSAEHKHHTKMAELHGKAMDAHTADAERHIDCIKALGDMPDVTTETDRGGSGDVSTGRNFDGKVATGSTAARMADDLARSFDNLQPTGAHAVMPSDMPDLRLVNRVGGAPIHGGDPTPDLDEALRKITA